MCVCVCVYVCFESSLSGMCVWLNIWIYTALLHRADEFLERVMHKCIHLGWTKICGWPQWIAINSLLSFSLPVSPSRSLSLSPPPSKTHTQAPPWSLCPAPDLSKYVANLKHVEANWKHWAFKTVDFSFAHANSSQEIPSDEMTQNMSVLGRHLGPRGEEGVERGFAGCFELRRVYL